MISRMRIQEVSFDDLSNSFVLGVLNHKSLPFSQIVLSKPVFSVFYLHTSTSTYVFRLSTCIRTNALRYVSGVSLYDTTIQKNIYP